MKITFVLPSDNRSGGVRATVAMANQLLQRGHIVRLVYPKIPRLSRAWVKSALSHLRTPSGQTKNAGWVYQFQGLVETFTNLNELRFEQHQVVIAVGSLTIDQVYQLERNVIKLRYNHGLLLNMSEKEKAMWALPIPTITVSRTIIPDLEKLTGHRVLAVVPNGIDPYEYHPVPTLERDGIGTIYAAHPAKAPKDTLDILNGLRHVLPQIPQYVFGTSPCPDSLSGVRYHRVPSVEEACALYNRAKVWFIASHTEGFSMPILEAMSCGCAVVSTDTYGGRELIRDSENGLLVPKGNVQASISAIQRVMLDEPLRARLVRAGQETANIYTWENAAAKMDAILTELVMANGR